MSENKQCEYPDCPTKEVTEVLKKIAERLADFKVFESDVRYIRETIDKLDTRLTKDVDSLFDRMRKCEADKVDKKDLYAAVAATGTIVGIISFIIQAVTK